MNRRNKPRQFHRNSPDIYDGWYCFGDAQRNGGGVRELGAKNLSLKQLNKLIDWLIRVRDYQIWLRKGKQ